MNTFPTLSSGQMIEGFTDEFSDDAVAIAPAPSGAPLLIDKSTFDGKNYSYSLGNVSQADKVTLETFYQANKGLAFYWLNEQNNVTYEMMFAERPHCELDDAKDIWKIKIKLLQA